MCMFTLRNLVIVATGAAAFAGLQSSNAQACDNDRFPCPVATEAAPVESPDAGATPAPTAQPRKKADRSTKPATAQNAAAKPALATQPRKQADRPARGEEKAQAKVARAAPGAATGRKTDKPGVPETVIAPTAQSPSVTENAGEAPLAGAPSNSSNAGLIATAGTDWAAFSNAEGGIATEPKVADATQAASQNSVQVVQTNEVNESDQAAITTIPAESAWITYVLLIFGAVLAVSAAIWFFRRTIPMYPRRVADQ
jgi:hypothetical protein